MILSGFPYKFGSFSMLVALSFEQNVCIFGEVKPRQK